VIFTYVLIIYLNWVHPLHLSPSSPSPVAPSLEDQVPLQLLGVMELDNKIPENSHGIGFSLKKATHTDFIVKRVANTIFETAFFFFN
jgi:hypothetical protein